MSGGGALAVVTARGGSKGLPGKNMHPFCGRPLLEWTLDAAREATGIGRCVVSSDCPRILELAQAFGALPVRRPAELAGDLASSESAVRHALLEPSVQALGLSTVVLLQPTSPLRTGADIDGAVDLLDDAGVDSVVSGHLVGSELLKHFVVGPEGFLAPVGGAAGYASMARQQLPPVFKPNGAVFVVRRARFLGDGQFFTEDCLPFTMDAARGVDIDTVADLRAAEAHALAVWGDRASNRRVG